MSKVKSLVKDFEEDLKKRLNNVMYEKVEENPYYFELHMHYTGNSYVGGSDYEPSDEEVDYVVDNEVEELLEFFNKNKDKYTDYIECINETVNTDECNIYINELVGELIATRYNI